MSRGRHAENATGKLKQEATADDCPGLSVNKCQRAMLLLFFKKKKNNKFCLRFILCSSYHMPTTHDTK